MRIGVSGAFLDKPNTGSGQYIINLMSELPQIEPSHAYHAFLPAGVVPKALYEPWLTATYQAPFGRHANLTKLWGEQISLPHLARITDLDLLHIPYFAPPLDTRTPIVVTIHDLIPLILPAYRGSRWVQAYTYLVSQTARRAQCILTDSHASARDIKRHLGIPTERIHVIYLAAHGRYHPIVHEERAPRLARLGITSPYFLYLGGFDIRKNLQVVLQAFSIAKGSLPTSRLVVAGKLPQTDTAFAPDPRRLADDLGLGDSVLYTGWIEEEDKPALYSGAQAFLFPSQYEGFGLPVLEAIACGAPVIVGSGSSLEEIAGPGGFVVDPRDYATTAQHMLHLVQNQEVRQAHSQLGLEHARQFSWHKTATETLQAYHSTLGKVEKTGRLI